MENLLLLGVPILKHIRVLCYGQSRSYDIDNFLNTFVIEQKITFVKQLNLMKNCFNQWCRDYVLYNTNLSKRHVSTRNLDLFIRNKSIISLINLAI